MSKNFQKIEFILQLFLFLLLFLMVIDIYAMAFFLMIIGTLSVLEFFKMISIILKK